MGARWRVADGELRWRGEVSLQVRENHGYARHSRMDRIRHIANNAWKMDWKRRSRWSYPLMLMTAICSLRGLSKVFEHTSTVY